MRRIFVVLVLIAIVGGTAWWLLKWDSGAHVPSDPWRAVPVNAAIIVEVPSPLNAWDRFTSTSQLWNAWEKTPGCVALDSLMSRSRDACEKDASLKRILDASAMLISMSASGEGFSTLISWSINDPKALRKLDPAFAALSAEGKAFEPSVELPKMEIAFADGLLLISDSHELIDDALTHLATASTTTDSSLVAARATLGAGSDAHVLVNTSRARRLLNAWLKPETLSGIEELDGWAALDIKLRPEAVLMSGVLKPRKVTGPLAAAMHQPVGKVSLARVIPANACWMMTSVVDDVKRYVADVVDSTPNDSLMNAYTSWVHGSIGQAIAHPSDSVTSRWAVLQAEDPLIATSALNARCMNGCDTMAYRNVRITRSPDVEALAAVFGPSFDAFERPWWCVLNDKVIFSDQLPAMREAIDAWTDGTSLAQDPRASGFFQRYASDASFTWWGDGAKGFDALRSMSKERGAATLDARHETWQRFGGCMVQVTPDEDGRFQITCCIEHASPTHQQQDARSMASARSRVFIANSAS